MRIARVRRLLVAGLAVSSALSFAACGEQEPSARVGEVDLNDRGGSLVWALPQPPSELDPLLARSRVDRLVTRQVHEPLIAELAGPFGEDRRVSGLAVSARSSGDRTIWRLRLRPNVRFQDGSVFNAAAVVANAERWQASADAARLVPGLVAIDAPRPDLVRFVLARPDRHFDEDLADPRLGIVSPRALGGGLGLRDNLESGTGPYEIRELGPGRALVARNTEWWGTRESLALGPALDQIEFPVVRSDSERFDLLAAGSVEVADSLGPAELRRLRRDPLLTVVRGAPSTGAERSVRGIEGDAPSLSGAWLTTVETG